MTATAAASAARSTSDTRSVGASLASAPTASPCASNATLAAARAARSATSRSVNGDMRRERLALEPVISTNQFKNGNHIEVEGTIFKILEFQHVKPGKGGAFVRTKLRRASDGNVIDRTFRAGEKFRSVRAENRRMQFLYADGSDAHFMDMESYEQIAVPESRVREALRWCPPSSEVDVLFID